MLPVVIDEKVAEAPLTVVVAGKRVVLVYGIGVVTGVGPGGLGRGPTEVIDKVQPYDSPAPTEFPPPTPPTLALAV